MLRETADRLGKGLSPTAPRGSASQTDHTKKATGDSSAADRHDPEKRTVANASASYFSTSSDSGASGSGISVTRLGSKAAFGYSANSTAISATPGKTSCSVSSGISATGCSKTSCSISSGISTTGCSKTRSSVQAGSSSGKASNASQPDNAGETG
jgi:hypothetical protein